jgi:hypothetical protein
VDEIRVNISVTNYIPVKGLIHLPEVDCLWWYKIGPALTSANIQKTRKSRRLLDEFDYAYRFWIRQGLPP